MTLSHQCKHKKTWYPQKPNILTFSLIPSSFFSDHCVKLYRWMCITFQMPLVSTIIWRYLLIIEYIQYEVPWWNLTLYIHVHSQIWIRFVHRLWKLHLPYHFGTQHGKPFWQLCWSGLGHFLGILTCHIKAEFH